MGGEGGFLSSGLMSCGIPENEKNVLAKEVEIDISCSYFQWEGRMV